MSGDRFFWTLLEDSREEACAESWNDGHAVARGQEGCFVLAETS